MNQRECNVNSARVINPPYQVIDSLVWLDEQESLNNGTCSFDLGSSVDIDDNNDDTNFCIKESDALINYLDPRNFLSPSLFAFNKACYTLMVSDLSGESEQNVIVE